MTNEENNLLPSTENTNNPSTIVVSQPSATTVVTTIYGPVYGPRPIRMQCPFCKKNIRTRLSYKATCRTNTIACLLCCFQLHCFFCIPYCCPLLSIDHYCGKCKHYLGTFSRQ